MKCHRNVWLVTAAIATTLVIGFAGWAAAQEQTPAAESPAQVGEKVGVEGTFVRVATNQEGWVVLGYRIANESAGKEWMLLDVGMTLIAGTKGQKITRDDIMLVTPDHKVISLPTQEEFEKTRGALRPLIERAARMGDSINYFPANVNQPCQIALFAEPGVAMAFDEVELSSNRACVGRLYFEVPGGIQYGNHNLDVQFENSVVRVPMDIMTEDEAKEFEKKWKEAMKEAKHKGHEH